MSQYPKKRISTRSIIVVQMVVLAAFGTAYFLANAEARALVSYEFAGKERFHRVPVTRDMPIPITRPYNRPDLISDETLAAVLRQIQPEFDRKEMKPNFVEHALRAWGVDATFQNPKAVSGQEMLEFLTDTAKFVNSWGSEIQPLLQERPVGIGVHWGTDTGASYHHDHLLACVTEANAPLNTPVYGPARKNATLFDVLQESMRDFRLDEREVEWTAMAFGLWICPEKEWIGSEGRHYSFDLIADRLMRGERSLGVCSGTHRVYSLMLLIRLDDEYHILSPDVRQTSYRYLEGVRDSIIESQFEDGHWPSNWPDGKEAVTNPVDDPLYRKVIATGHHLEWMSIAPPDLLVPEEQLKKAVDWIVETTLSQPRSKIHESYTFYSHVGAALSNWRQERPASFWKKWEEAHPGFGEIDAVAEEAKTESEQEKPVEAAH
ncbi:hypothetical protein SH668x_001104 [Planctomicrobium sp. SH668]|uniref:hypothetical protein n=1 Tax=Planctomicrobium sp. SH668 TaxID=3448126 RepID=UPI003F5C0C38